MGRQGGPERKRANIATEMAEAGAEPATGPNNNWQGRAPRKSARSKPRPNKLIVEPNRVSLVIVLSSLSIVDDLCPHKVTPTRIFLALF